MEHANGSAANWRQMKERFPDMQDEMAEEHQGPTSGKEQQGNLPPAMVFTNGRVLTRVWANPNHWGEITWKVDQLRIRATAAKGAFGRSYFLDDLQDAMRGLYRAQRWIKKTERRRWLRRFLSK